MLMGQIPTWGRSKVFSCWDGLQLPLRNEQINNGTFPEPFMWKTTVYLLLPVPEGPLLIYSLPR